jgi:hypothetical protein
MSESNPIIASLLSLIGELDNLKNLRGRILEEAVQKCQNFNALDDLTLVHQGKADRGPMFEKHKYEFE